MWFFRPPLFSHRFPDIRQLRAGKTTKTHSQSLHKCPQDEYGLMQVSLPGDVLNRHFSSKDTVWKVSLSYFYRWGKLRHKARWDWPRGQTKEAGNWKERSGLERANLQRWEDTSQDVAERAGRKKKVSSYGWSWNRVQSSDCHFLTPLPVGPCAYKMVHTSITHMDVWQIAD